MILIALALVATFTLPAFNAPPSGGCGGGEEPLTDLGYLRVYVSRQSPTWVAHRTEMLSSEAAWNTYWPTVRSEAAPVLLSRIPLAPEDAGTRYTITFPTMPFSPAFFRVATEDLSGNVSCLSNPITQP